MRIDDRIRIALLVGGVALAIAIPVASALNDGEGTAETAAPSAQDQANGERETGGADVPAGHSRLEVVEAAGWQGAPDLDELLDRYEEFADGLADHLAEEGFAHDVRRVPVVTWDLSDSAANRAVMEYVGQSDLPALILGSGTGVDLGGLLPDVEFPFEEFDGEWGAPFELPAGMVDELNARADELAEFLDGRGIDYEVGEGPHGIRWVIPDARDPEVREALEDFAAEHGGLVIGVEGMPGFDLGGLLPDIESLFEEFDGEWGTAFGCPDGDCPWRHLLEGLLGDRHLLER